MTQTHAVPSISYTGLHLFLGPDRANKLRRIQEFERVLGVEALDRHAVDAATITSAELVALCRQRPAASSARLIIVDRAQRLAADGVSALVQHASVIAQTACVVLLIEEELGVRHPLSSHLRGTGVHAERFPLRESTTVKPFALIDALGNRDVPGALLAVHEQLVHGKEPLELLGLVAWQLQRWVIVRRLLDAGHGTAHIAEAAGLRPWQAQRIESEVCGRTLASLQALLSACWQLDTDAKRSAVIPQLAVEQLVLEVCQ